MRLRIALDIYAGLYPGPLSANSARLATERLHRLMQYREWGRAELRELIRRRASDHTLTLTEPWTGVDQ